MQLDQQPIERNILDELMSWAFSLPDIAQENSKISVPGTQAMSKDKMCTHCNAFMVESEFAHFHPAPDGSMHLGLPQRDVKKVIEQGWGEWHLLFIKVGCRLTLSWYMRPETTTKLRSLRKLFLDITSLRKMN